MLLRSATRQTKTFLILALAAILLAAPVAQAGAQRVSRPANAKGWSELIHARYSKIKSMAAQFEQTVTHKESGIEEQRSGNLYFQKPFLVRWVSNPPFSETIVVDKEHLWQYFPDEELALKFKAAAIEDQGEFLAVLTGRAPLIEKFKIVPSEEVEGVYSLKLIPYSPSMSLVEATIWVDMESGLILRLLYADFYGNLNDIAFVNQELDVRMPSDAFSFKIPPGTVVEDHAKAQ